MEHKRVAVVFGERDGIKIGHSLLAINGTPVTVAMTGVKFLIVCDPKQMGVDQLLEKIYELYADFAL